MSNRSIFYEDWRECLRAHYLHVIRVNDTLNQASLVTVLLDTGFDEDEIARMQADYASAPAQSAAEIDTTEIDAAAETAPPPAEVERIAEAPAPSANVATEPPPSVAQKSDAQSSLGTYQPSLF